MVRAGRAAGRGARWTGGGGESVGPGEVSGVGAGPGAFSLALLSCTDVDTLARARAGGGRLGPRRGG